MDESSWRVPVVPGFVRARPVEQVDDLQNVGWAAVLESGNR